MYKILIADDHPLFREAIHNVIADGFPGSEIMETADLDSALALTQEHDDLDLILLDLSSAARYAAGHIPCARWVDAKRTQLG
ncbi:response regulator, partial [Escherichia coli]